MTKNEKEAYHPLDDSRKATVRFINGKHSFEVLKNKKCLYLLIVLALG